MANTGDPLEEFEGASEVLNERVDLAQVLPHRNNGHEAFRRKESFRHHQRSETRSVSPASVQGPSTPTTARGAEDDSKNTVAA